MDRSDPPLRFTWPERASSNPSRARKPHRLGDLRSDRLSLSYDRPTNCIQPRPSRTHSGKGQCQTPRWVLRSLFPAEGWQRRILPPSAQINRPLARGSKRLGASRVINLCGIEWSAGFERSAPPADGASSPTRRPPSEENKSRGVRCLLAVPSSEAV